MKRITLELKDPELIRWVQEYTGAPSLSEAIFQALHELRCRLDRQRQELLDRTYGLWEAEDQQLEEALRELKAGWNTWRMP